jgi:hypothetical protein
MAMPLALAACGSSGPSLPKLSMFGSSDSGAPATTGSTPDPPPPATPEQRAAQVGATSARAVKCGYNFDPARLRANYLAAEAQFGTSVEQLGKVEKAYDTINGKVAGEIARDGGYCTEAKTREIKADLTRHMAGDYSPPTKQVAQGPSFWDSISGQGEAPKPFNADEMWDKTGEQKRRR